MLMGYFASTHRKALDCVVLCHGRKVGVFLLYCMTLNKLFLSWVSSFILPTLWEERKRERRKRKKFYKERR